MRPQIDHFSSAPGEPAPAGTAAKRSSRARVAGSLAAGLFPFDHSGSVRFGGRCEWLARAAVFVAAAGVCCVLAGANILEGLVMGFGFRCSSPAMFLASVALVVALIAGAPGALAASPCGTGGQFSQSGTSATCTYTSPGTEDTFMVPGG
jgi:hypothetical protein